MAHSPKKGRPASVTLVRTPDPVIETLAPETPVVIDAPAVEAMDVSSLALQAAELPAPAPELPETPPAFEASALPEIVAAVEAAPPPVVIAAPAAEAPAPAPAATPAQAAPFAVNVRSLVEKGLTQTREHFESARTAAQETAAAVEASYGAVQSGVAALNAKAIEALASGAHAQFDHFASLAGVKTFSELLTLQSEFARKRIEEAQTQAKQMTELARKVADESVAPIKAHVAKTFKIAV